MLSEEQLDKLIQPIISIYGDIEAELIIEIAKRFKNYDEIGGTLENQLKKLQELGGLNEDVIKIFAKYSQKSEEAIKTMLAEAGFMNLDTAVIAEAVKSGVTDISLEKLMESQTIANVINNSYKELNETFRLIQTTAQEAVKKEYIGVINQAYVETASGFYDYNTAIKRAVTQMAKKGISGATYRRSDGRAYQYGIEGTVRRDVLTAVHQTANKTTIQSCQELNTDFVEVSAHIGARTHPTNPIANHFGWQGKVYKVNGSAKGYPNLKEKTGYPDDILGLGGVNCRHRMFPFFPGISKPNNQRIDEKENERVYKESQTQRRLEREIRRLKKVIYACDAMGDDEGKERYKAQLNRKFAQIQAFCDSTGRKRDYSRERVLEQYDKNTSSTYNKDTSYTKIEGKDTEYFKGTADKYIMPVPKIKSFLLKPGTKHYDEFKSVGYTPKDIDKLNQDIYNEFNENDMLKYSSLSTDPDSNVLLMDLGITKKKTFLTAWKMHKESGKYRFISAHLYDGKEFK